MKRPPVPRVRGGFTLAEVVIALGIVAFGVLAVVGIFSIARRLERAAREDLAASVLIRQMETELQLPGSIRPPGEKTFAPVDPEGRLLGGLVPLSGEGFGQESDPLVLAFDGDGLCLGQRSAETYQQGSSDNRAQYLLAFWAEPDPSGALDVSLRVETPASRPAAHRRQYDYWCSVTPTR